MTHLKDLASVLLPDFVEANGHVFAKCAASKTALLKRRGALIPEWEGLDHTGVEAFENHLHVLDVFRHDPKVWSERRQQYRTRHPDFVAAQTLGKVIAYAWFGKLQRDFPQYRFRVYYARDDNPTVRFHRVYRGEPVWLDERERHQDIQDGRLLVLDTKKRRG
jgi:hypothetical protein